MMETITRERINTATPQTRPLARLSMEAPRRKRKAPSETFAMLPRIMTNNPAQYGLGVIEFAALAGLIRGATESLHQHRDAKAQRAGNIALVRHQQRNGRHYDGRAQHARKRAYDKRMKNLKANDPVPDVLSFDMTTSALLRHCGLYVDDSNMARIDAALARLSKPIIESLPPLLLSRRMFLHSDETRYFVSSAWIKPPTVKIPIPLPTKSLLALNLLVFLRAISMGNSIRLDKLCQWIGMKPCAPYEQARQLEATLEVVWKCIGENKTTSSPRRNDVPAWYAMSIKDGRVYFGQSHRGRD